VVVKDPKDTGCEGHRVEALPLDRTVEILNRHDALKTPL
jgi:hypothetical protein